MPKRKQIDNKALIKDINDGVTQDELLKKYGFKNPISLKNAYLNALVEEQGIEGIKGAGRQKKDKPIETKITVNKRKTLTITKALIESMDIEAGEIFEVKKSTKGISLTKVASEIKEPEKKEETKEEKGETKEETKEETKKEAKPEAKKEAKQGTKQIPKK